MKRENLRNLTRKIYIWMALALLLTSSSAEAQTIAGQWDFDNRNLSATIGRDIQLIGGASAQAKTFIGSTSEFQVSPIGGEPANVLQFGAYGVNEALAVYHGMPANGGGAKVNQYTIVMDVMFDKSERNLWAIFQTNAHNFPKNDADFYYVNNANDSSGGGPVNGLGISGAYHNLPTPIQPGEWHRIAVAVDLAIPYMFKYVDGIFVGGNDAAGLDNTAIDQRFALNPADSNLPLLLFTENDPAGPDIQHTGSGYLSSLQIRPYTMASEEIAELGGPSATGILPKDATPISPQPGPPAQPVSPAELPLPIPPAQPLVSVEPLKWHDHLSGFNQITTDKRPGLILFTIPTLNACKKMEQQLESQKLRELLSPFVLIKVHATEESEIAQKGYGVYRVPTLVFVNKDGKVKHKRTLKSREISVSKLQSIILKVGY